MGTEIGMGNGSSVLLPEVATHRCGQVWDLVLYDIPENVVVDAEVGVGEHVAHSRYTLAQLSAMSRTYISSSRDIDEFPFDGRAKQGEPVHRESATDVVESLAHAFDDFFRGHGGLPAAGSCLS